ncbi:MAG: BolA family transcriptional regulator [Hyphomicrobiaceae bacterium]
MPMNANDIEKLIKDRFPGAEVTIKDLAGDGDHYSAHVVAPQFKGKNRVQQHKMVYDALEGRMGGVLHALALTTAVKDM